MHIINQLDRCFTYLKQNLIQRKLSIARFDITNQKSISLHFRDDNNNLFIHPIENIFNNKILTRGFSNKDAYRIGRMYAKKLFNINLRLV